MPVVPLVPAGQGLIFLGDGEFSGVGLLRLIAAHGGRFVCRIGKNTRLREQHREPPD